MATTDIVTLDNGLTFEGSGRNVLDSLVIETINQADLMPNYKNMASIIGFVDTTLISPDQKVSFLVPPTGLSKITETGVKPMKNFNVGPKKGIYQSIFGDKFAMSYDMMQWARNAKTIQGAPDAIQAELVSMAQQARYLVAGYDITRAEEMLKVLTLGFAVTAPEGPGSITPKGLSLFNASHTIATGGTQSNLVTGASYTNVATGITQLQTHLDLLRKMKFDNGKKPDIGPDPFVLLCSRERENFWRLVLNDGSSFSWQGSNANTLSQFNFKGNMVELRVLPMLGETSADGSALGTTDMYFVINQSGMRKSKGLQTYSLYSPRVKSYEDNDTDQYITGIRSVTGADHYTAEYFITGCQQ